MLILLCLCSISGQQSLDESISIHNMVILSPLETAAQTRIFKILLLIVKSPELRARV